MKNYLYKIMQGSEPGFYACELPTGIGKTFSAAYAMKEYITNDNVNKIIYITQLNKNIDDTYEELRKAFNDDALFNNTVLKVQSNFDLVVNNLNSVEIPDKLKSDNYQTLLDKINIFNKAKSTDKFYLDNLKEEIRKLEYSFRKEITKLLKDKTRNKVEKLNLIKNNKDYHWIGELYPQVYTDERKIILMSVSMFLKRNSVIVENSYEFLSENFLKNSIIIMDEFDATKQVIKDDIIEKANRSKSDYISLFNHLTKGLNVGSMSKELSDSLKQIKDKYSIEKLVNDGNELYKNYHLDLSIKTISENVDKLQNFLFNDGTYHTIIQNGKSYIRLELNKEDNRVRIHFEDKYEFYKNLDKKNPINIYKLFDNLSSYLNSFKRLLLVWANEYSKIINEKRNLNDEMFSLEDSLKSIMSKLDLTDKERMLITDDILQSYRNNRKQFDTVTFYQNGFEYYDFEDNDSHNDNTLINYLRVNETPEQILLYMCNKATVIGISATAEIDTVIGNYDLGYLKSELKERYHSTPKYLIDNIKKTLDNRNKNYKDININCEVYKNDKQIVEILDYIKEFLDDEKAQIATNVISNSTGSKYHQVRYANLLKAFDNFNKKEDIKSFLYLGMKLPSYKDDDFNRDVIDKLWQLAKNNDIESNIVYLTSDKFEENKETMLEMLGKGKKVFVISSYQTIGAGQNLQYDVPSSADVIHLGEYTENNARYKQKDFDGIYLGDYTNMTINTYSNAKINSNDLLTMLFQIEELYANSEISYEEKKQMFKLAFKSYIGTSQYSNNILYRQKSVINQATRAVLQAIGRLSRTLTKNRSVELIIEENLLSKLNKTEAQKRIVIPELEAILRKKEELGSNIEIDSSNQIRNEADKVSTYANRTIKKVLSKNWTDESMEFWANLRDTTLKYPTATEEERKSNSNIERFYITSGKPQNSYLYSTINDFSDVVVDFNNDKEAFINSKRAKQAFESSNFVVLKGNMEDTNLDKMLKYDGLKDYFISKGYSIEFKENLYMMSPTLLHNIYKGALGEVVGKFILEKELGINLKEITDPDKFEFFDFALTDDVYVDFKNWKFSYSQDRNKVEEKIIAKLDAIKGKRAYIINICSDKDFKPLTTKDERIVEIPMLIDDKGQIVKGSLNMIKQEDILNAYK